MSELVIANKEDLVAVADAIREKTGSTDELSLTSMANVVSAIQTENVQPDWNQNDETSSDYIINRPFYTTEPVETIVINNETFNFESEGNYYASYNSTDISLIIGQNYTVIWDGTSYENLTCFKEGNCNSLGEPYENIRDNNMTTVYPFNIERYDGGIEIYTNDTTNASHTVSIIGYLTEDIQIPEKYISYKPGKVVTGNSYVVDGETLVAQTGAEIFNDYNNKATGYYSHAEGGDTIASGFASHAEGTNTKAIGYCTHAEGSNTKAIGDFAHAEGGNTKASGNISHTEGSNTIATGASAHAEGQRTEANGEHSHAEGQGTIASSTNQHVQGKYNISDTNSKYSHIVGNGTKRTNRSNAHTLDWSGNAWFAGDVYIGGSGQDDTENVKKLVTTDELPEGLPTVTSDDNGKVLMVVDGKWAVVSLT